MTFLKKPRETIGRYWLNNLLKGQHRTMKIRALDQLKTAAILFNASSERCYRQTKLFAKQLSQNQTQVKAIGYIESHKQVMPYIGDQTFVFITLNDFSFFYLPQSHQVKEFIATPFDALFILTANNYCALKTMAHLSIAHFKVGFTDIWDDAMDLTFEIPDHNSEELVKQINFYLNTIKIDSTT